MSSSGWGGVGNTCSSTLLVTSVEWVVRRVDVSGMGCKGEETTWDRLGALQTVDPNCPSVGREINKVDHKQNF